MDVFPFYKKQNVTPKIKHRLGDFSFIQNRKERFILEIDFYALNYNNGWDLLNQMKNRSFKKDNYTFDGVSVWDTPPDDPWYNIQKNMFMGHTKESLTRSIKLFRYLHKHGWNQFVINYTKI